MSDEEPAPLEAKPIETPRVVSVSLTVGKRCPTCGKFPTDFRGQFTRVVEETFIDPSKSIHLTLDRQTREPRVWKPMDPGPAELYTAVIVPNYLLGKVVVIREQTELDRQIEAEEDDRREREYQERKRLRGE